MRKLSRTPNVCTSPTRGERHRRDRLQIPESPYASPPHEISYGHTASFRAGLVVGLDQLPGVEVSNGHELTYRRGKEMGGELHIKVADLERLSPK